MEGLKVFPIDPEGMDQSILDQAWALVKKSGINILRDKTLGGVAIIGDKVVGALFVPEGAGQKYSFDIVVDPQYQRQGIGMQLARLGKSMFDPEQYPEGMEMDAVSPGGRHISEQLGLRKEREIGEHWIYKQPNRAEAWVRANCRFAQAQVSFDNAPLLALVEKDLDYLRRAIEERQELTATPFDIAAYQKSMETALVQVPGPLAGMFRAEFGNIVSMYQAGNIEGARDAIADTIHKIIGVDFQKQHGTNWGMLRAAYKVLTDLDEHISAATGQHAPMEQYLAEYRTELMQDYNKALAQVADIEGRLKTFAQASGRNDVSFRIEPNFAENWETKSKVMYPLHFSVDIVFAAEGRDEFPPSVTLFAEEKDGEATGRYTADDVLSWGDTDFFADASQSKFYFDLLDYIKTGKLPTERGTKFIRLYRGMSMNEYALWERGETIPAGKFFTKDRTAEKAMDVSGEFPELFSFSVREDVVVDVGDNNYQTSVPARMVNKRIVPVVQAQAWVRTNCRFAQEKKWYSCTLYIGSHKFEEKLPREAVSEAQAEAQFWYSYTNGQPWKIDDLKQKGYAVRCVEKPPDPSPAPVPQPRPKPQQGFLFPMGPDPFKR